MKKIGIIGGMGPKATCDLMQKIIMSTDAKNDQEHIHIFVDCNTNIPDRTKAIFGEGESPVPEIVNSGKNLQSMGADLLVMSCNTAHYFYDKVVKHLDIPLLNMPDETAIYLKNMGIKKVGVLATDGTIESGIYEKSLKRHGIDAIYPSSENQKFIMELIYDYIKSGRDDYDDSRLKDILDELKEKGAEKIILGCTELPIAFERLGENEDLVDPTLVLAYSAVSFAGAKLNAKIG